MKINVKEAKVTSNVPQENVTAMSISVDGMEHIMDLLTNLYKDPELAVIREYYTNALDAHVEAGVEKPVEITLPTWADPTYKVTDHGVGMSKDDITNIYAQYGASTKRQTNGQLGAFGLGCKSALTITQQFTVVSVKNGFKTTVLIAKTESGINTVNVISSIATTESNGTTVKIPVKSNTYSFNSKAHRFFAFSRPGTVLVDGIAPTFALDEARKVEDPNNKDLNLYVKPKSDGESYVLMGPVPYALSQVEVEQSLKRLDSNASRGFIRMPKYFDVPIGSVDLTPSREGLRFTDKTNEVIDAHISFLVKDLKEIAQKEIDEATSLSDIYEIHEHWNNVINLPRTYKGKAVPKDIRVQGDVRKVERTTWGSNSHTVSSYLDLNPGRNVTLISGYSADNYKKVNGYITPYMASLGKESGTFIFTDVADIFDNEWVAFSDDFTIVPGDDIIETGREFRKQERLAAAKVNGSTKKSVIRYPVLFVDDEEVRWVEHAEIAEDTPYLHAVDTYGNISELIQVIYKRIGFDRSIGGTTAEYFERVTDAKEIILLNKTRTVKALQQRVKKTYSLVPQIDAAVAKVGKLITPDLTKHHAVADSSWKRFLVNSGISHVIDQIKDPEIVSILKPSDQIVDQYEEFSKTRDALLYFRTTTMAPVPYIDHTASYEHMELLNDKYPLVDSLNVWSLKGKGAEHMVKYFNVIHEELVSV